jgi:hypothetical protein
MAKKTRRRKLPWWKKLLFTSALVVLLLVGLELLLRVCGCGPPAAPAAPETASATPPKLDPLAYFALCDRYLGFRNRPHGTYHTWYIEGNPLVTTDEFGYRNGFGWPGDPLGGGDWPIVLFVGDSVTFCSEVNDQQTGPSEVAKLLSRDLHVRVLNAGVRGYSTLQAKRMLLESLQRFPRIKVVVYTFCANDIEENLVPNLRYPLKAPVIMRDPASGEFHEVEVTNPVVRWGESFLGWQAPPPNLSSADKVATWLGARSVLCYRCLAGWHELTFGLFWPPEFPDGTRVVPPSDYPKWHTWAHANGGSTVLQRLLAEMDQACRAHGAVFLVTSAFTGTHFEGCRVFSADCARDCAAAGVRFVSMEHEFPGDALSYCSLRTDGNYDGHYGPLGTKTYAKALAPALKEILRSEAGLRSLGRNRN